MCDGACRRFPAQMYLDMSSSFAPHYKPVKAGVDGHYLLLTNKYFTL